MIFEELLFPDLFDKFIYRQPDTLSLYLATQSAFDPSHGLILSRLSAFKSPNEITSFEVISVMFGSVTDSVCTFSDHSSDHFNRRRQFTHIIHCRAVVLNPYVFSYTLLQPPSSGITVVCHYNQLMSM